MHNPFVSDICEHICNVYKRNSREINDNEVRIRFSHFIMNESMGIKYSSVMDKFYGKTISDTELMSFVDDVLMSPVNEGFENPFSDDVNDYHENFIMAYDEANTKDRDFVKIKKISLYDPRATRHTYVKGGRMYSGRQFVKGDMIEECPVVILDKSDLYSRKIRDLAFEIDASKNLYGMPVGYANVYRTTSDPNEGNLDYEYDPSYGNIKFYAIKGIMPNDELVLLTQDSVYH